ADSLDLAGAFQLGLIVGAVVAIGYLWLGAILIAIGLIFRSKPQWSPAPSSAPPRLAFVTATSGDLGSLEQQRRFLRDVASGVPHVVVDDLA
ncbi:MAG: hypothetical protein DI618_04695, partial [Dermacoccus nishinomiyaensis]